MHIFFCHVYVSDWFYRITKDDGLIGNLSQEGLTTGDWRDKNLVSEIFFERFTCKRDEEILHLEDRRIVKMLRLGRKSFWTHSRETLSY